MGPLVGTPSSEILRLIGSHEPQQSKLSHMHRTSQKTAAVVGGAVAAVGVPGNRGWKSVTNRGWSQDPRDIADLVEH
jgi:hypothetical protein